MTSEFETKVLSELAALRSAVESLRSDFTISQITFFENLPPTAVVGAEYVSYRFGCSQEAVIRGRFETDKIRRFRNKPVAYIKRDVDSVWLTLNQSVSDKALEIRHRTNKRKVKKS